MKMPRYAVVSALLILLLPFQLAWSQAIPYDATGCGGGESSSGGIFLYDTMGQAAIDEAQHETDWNGQVPG